MPAGGLQNPRTGGPLGSTLDPVHRRAGSMPGSTEPGRRVTTYRDDYNDHSIVVETEKVEHRAFDKLVRVKSVVIRLAGKDLGYSYPKYEGTSETRWSISRSPTPRSTFRTATDLAAERSTLSARQPQRRTDHPCWWCRWLDGVDQSRTLAYCAHPTCCSLSAAAVASSARLAPRTNPPGAR